MADLHSSKQLVEEDKLPAAIQAAIALLRGKFIDQEVRALRWNAFYVAIPLVVSVELPGRGPVNQVDIRRQEPILLLLDRQDFPHIAPRVYSDRLDFPKSTFPHINVTAAGAPAWFCLHRGSIDAWFAEHTVIDLVERARGWLRDAARDRLVPEDDGFEPTRAAETFGTFVYTPDANIEKVIEQWTEQRGAAGSTLVAFDLLDDESKAEIGTSGYSVRQAVFVSEYVFKEHKAIAAILNELAEKPEYKGQFQRRLFGLLVWATEDQTSAQHFGELPKTLGELEKWSEDLGLPLKAALESYLSDGFHLFGGVPIILAIRRPQHVLGTDSDIELMNLLVLAGGDHRPNEGVWDMEAEVNLADHRTPLTPAFAQKISAIPDEGSAGPVVVFGAGALGSKVTSHLGRSGSVDVKIVDNAKISPHNLVRHALGGRAIGLSKAEALKDELVKLYPGQAELPLQAKNASALACLKEAGFFEGYAHLIDMTASNVVFNALRDANLPETIRVHRAEIAHRGRLGLLSIEGAGRNPRLDDLQTLIFDSAINDDAVATWLNEVKATRDDRVGSGGLEDIQIGLSCNSATMRLADEVVSFHAAAATSRLRPYLAKHARSNEEGAVYKSYLGEDGESRASTRICAPTVVLDAGSGWEIRIAASVAEEMSESMRRHSPRETGGILVGRIAATRKTIYVTRLVAAPPDSRGTPYVFTRGTEQLPEALDQVHRRTGGLLTYVGEWHTHPMGDSDLSETDKNAVVSLRSILDRARQPTLVTVVTPNEIRPHLFEPTSPPLILEPPTRAFRIIRAVFGWRRR